MVKGFAVCLMGAAAMTMPTEVSARAMFACPFVECVWACPQDILEWCHTHGCDTDLQSSNCDELFECSGERRLVWCGTPIDT
jgi:hypothetical protein